MKRRIKEWYIKTYPTDELGEEIKEDVKFIDVFIALDANLDVYRVIGVDDSVIRERIFSELAETMDVDYGYIYNKWLKGA